MTEEGRTRYHYGFYAAMKVEYDLIKAHVRYEQEIQLGEDPVRLDFLIIKKQNGVELTDPIGSFFKRVNLFEYKSPEDGLTIDDFYKAQGYALIYKGYDRKVNELPIEEITLTIVRHAYPRELIKELEKERYAIESDHPGIYKVNGRNAIPTQIVVTSRLPDGEYKGLRLLVDNTSKEDVISFSEAAIASGDERIKTNAGTVISVCLSANVDLRQRLKEDKAMNEIIKEVFKEDFEKAEEKGKEDTAVQMLRDNVSAGQISRWTGFTIDRIKAIAKKAGVASITL